jgi:PIN domain nuclease of toxin-antitoxin system
MKLLLDTCCFLWALHEPKLLSPRARKALQDPACSVHVSVITLWEISLKAGLGKLSFEGVVPEDYSALAIESGWCIHPLIQGTASSAGRLSRNPDHRDPFDRLLIWTAINEDFSLVSGDEKFPHYAPHGLKICW